jgi:hypothetical protein
MCRVSNFIALNAESKPAIVPARSMSEMHRDRPIWSENPVIPKAAQIDVLVKSGSILPWLNHSIDA